MMKYFVKSLKFIGFIAMLLGMGSMDSAYVAVPIAMMFLGIALFVFGNHVEESYSWEKK